MLNLYRVFAPFLDCVHSFGFKTGEDDEIWNGYRRSVYTDSAQGTKILSYEFCYAIRYVDKNGRPEGSPWSLRQTAVYQSYDFSRQSSRWILLQPSTAAQRRFEEFQRLEPPGGHPMRLHLIILHSALANWKAYIGYTRKELDSLDEKACFSRLGRTHKHDYKVTFADSQRVQNIRERLLRTIVVLDTCQEVARGYELHCRELETLRSSTMPPNLLSEIEAYGAQLRFHHRAVKAMLERSAGTMELLFKILEQRNDEEFSRSRVQLHRDIEVMRTIGSQTRDGSEVMAQLSKQNRADTRSLKALSVLGVLYLPVTLVATIFSSTLIQVQSEGNATAKTHFELASQFWIFIAITLPLMALTLGYAVWLERT